MDQAGRTADRRQKRQAAIWAQNEFPEWAAVIERALAAANDDPASESDHDFGLMKEGKDVGIDELVADACAFFVAADDASAVQDGEMLRDVLLRRLERIDQFPSGHGPRRKTVDELDAQWLANHAQLFRDQVRSPI